jgi:mycothiol synthase
MTRARADIDARTGALEGPTIAHVEMLAHAARASDGVEALGEQTLLDLRDHDARVVHLLARTDGAAAGYAQLQLPGAGVPAGPAKESPDLSAEVVVDPAHRRQGIGTALLVEVLALATAHQRRAAVWAHGNLPAAAGLAEKAGLVVVRELWQMSRDLRGDEPHPEVPDGIVVRPFVQGTDEEAWLRVNAAAFADHPDQGRMTMRDLLVREQEPWFRADDLLLAERDGEVVASVWMKVEGAIGELYVLGVDPRAQGHGLGRLLTAMTLAHLAVRGCDRAVLYTAPTSPAAVRTYQWSGFTTSRVDVQYGEPADPRRSPSGATMPP